METVYVLIVSEMGSEQHVIKKLLMIDEIKEVNQVWGGTCAARPGLGRTHPSAAAAHRQKQLDRGN